MSVCAVMLVKDEADIIEYTLRHLIEQVDHVIVRDNGSTDGTGEIILDMLLDPEIPLELGFDGEVGYYQSVKTTALAVEAFNRGFKWVLPCDADEYWYAPDLRPIRDFLDGLAPDVQIVTGDLYNHIPTALDVAASQSEADASYPYEPDPFKRIGWRQREHGALPKVCCRTRPDLVIHAGNHGASTSGTALKIPGLVVRHYSWRSAHQYLRKIRNGEAAYKATTLPETTGAHWRMWEGVDDQAILDHFDRWFYSHNPTADTSMIYDPAPGA